MPRSLTGQGEPSLLSRERDRVALEQAAVALHDAGGIWPSRSWRRRRCGAASQSLERLLGRIDAERVLDRLFPSFCIGK